VDTRDVALKLMKYSNKIDVFSMAAILNGSLMAAL